MNWDDVRIFLAVARAGQILGAAKRLELNHATVSRRVAALEGALRTKLFRRLTTGSELTPAGERFLDIAERMEGDMIAARSTVAGEGDDVSGTVRIGAPDGFGVAFLAKRLGALTALHRELTIQLVPVPRSFSLSRREADIAITVERPTEGRLVAGKLVDYTLGLFASRAYTETHGLPQTPAELGRHTLIGYVPDLIVSPSLDYAAEFSADWRTSFAISSALGQAEAVRSGAGIGILHTFVARSMPELVAVDIVAPIRRAYWLVYHESVRPLRRVQIVASFITKAVERERGLFV
ncbi:LysR family transcriptional regulator [Mesorhizobium sp.]|uniref:LysR family transcriptional regulator n=2 Tax=Mesorhizobium sp. TaxID=1871066 RepID=UPI000FE8F861|nr:LysR family transcriptional regulator [Mesorhizobium sp.]RWB26281.1 MAG: LysR family transcriptional regulator [Mesorhizobium sp.]RWD37950.1 MAG: LysR family transcriptional regulator [Mesorhizobium sp.]RWD45601.1 MAG: LysR family transcriptional regulator [Mesorhizobium sp.]RWD82607.1 MAG: LysR family transcriptional regulator [Mesorhizobium sp.]RWE99662.1 MAG: LysR family transcriptional regulator [Mesorhizobium sp.]